MLFSEPKIPQCKFSSPDAITSSKFQCSSASRKFLNSSALNQIANSANVSVLFSEPKIPQFASAITPTNGLKIRFSALQRAENSSIVRWRVRWRAHRSFSALQRAENSSIPIDYLVLLPSAGFSALQRAENSSIHTGTRIAISTG